MPESIRFARRFDGISGSAIREIFKLIAQPDMISFAGGNPSPSALPDAEAARIAAEVLRESGKTILQYGATEGYRPFLESLKPYAEQSVFRKGGVADCVIIECHGQRRIAVCLEGYSYPRYAAYLV